MKIRTTLILLLAAALVGGAIMLSELWHPAPHTDGDLVQESLLKLKREEITRITATGKDESAIFLRLPDGTNWALENPPGAPESGTGVPPVKNHGQDAHATVPVDPYEIKCVLDALVDAREEGRVSAADAKKKGEKEYGLDKPRLVLEIETQKQTVRLTVGANAPVADRAYARLGNNEDVVVILTSLVAVFDKPIVRFRDRRLARFEFHKLRAVELHTPTGKTKLERQSGIWKLTAPFEDTADTTPLSNLLTALQECKAERFEADGVAEAEFAKYGLGQEESKTARVILWLSGSEKPLELFFGNAPTDSPNLVFARSSTESGTGVPPVKNHGQDAHATCSSVYAVSDSIVSLLSTPSAAFRSRNIFFFNPADVYGIQIRNEKVLAEVKKEPIISWRPLVPAAYEFDARRADFFVQLLAGLKADEFVAEKMEDLELFGLLVPEYKLTISLEEEVKDASQQGAGNRGEAVPPMFRKRDEILRVGVVRGTPGAADKVFGQIEGQSKVVALPAWFAELLFRGHLNFVSLAINEIYVADVEAVEFSMDAKFLRVCQDQNMKWNVADSKNLSGQPRGFEAAVGTFRGLSAADIVAGKVEMPSNFGFENPYLVVKAVLRTEPPSATPKERKLIIANKDDKGRYLACVEGQGYVYLLEEAKVKAMAAPME